MTIILRTIQCQRRIHNFEKGEARFFFFCFLYFFTNSYHYVAFLWKNFYATIHMNIANQNVFYELNVQVCIRYWCQFICQFSNVNSTTIYIPKKSPGETLRTCRNQNVSSIFWISNSSTLSFLSCLFRSVLLDNSHQSSRWSTFNAYVLYETKKSHDNQPKKKGYVRPVRPRQNPSLCGG